MSDWRPDWRETDAYDFAESLSLSGWAWQFLRRNPDYQRDYADAEARARRASAEGFEAILGERPAGTPGPIWTDEQTRAFRQRWGIWPPTAPSEGSEIEEKPGEPPLLLAFVGRTEGPPPGLLIELERLRRELNEVTPHSTAGPLPDWAEVRRRDETPEQFEWRQHLRGATLDLRIALEPQLRSIERQARHQQAMLRAGRALDPSKFPEPASHEDAVPSLEKVADEIKPSRAQRPGDKARWVRYLRFLDAEAAGASPDEMASVLFPEIADPVHRTDGARAVSEGLRKAKRLSEPDGYLKFLGLS